MPWWASINAENADSLKPFLGLPIVRSIAPLYLCTPYLQGGFYKICDFQGAIAEMKQFGLLSPATMASLVITLELCAPAMILTETSRWLGGLLLAAFTLSATFLANRIWIRPASEHATATNSFFEHLALAGGLLLVAWHDVAAEAAGRVVKLGP